jgi:tight adherence protein C
VLQTAHEIASVPFVVRIGEMTFAGPAAAGLIVAVATAFLAAVKLWRIAQSENRQKRLFDALARAAWDWPQPESSARLPWYQRLGALMAATRIIGKGQQARLLAALVAAGINGHGHLAALLGAKLCSAAAFAPLFWLLLEWRQCFVGATTLRLLLVCGAAVLGWRSPNVVLSRLAARRRRRLEIGIPDALDLLVICAEAGLSLDHAIEQVGRVLGPSNREVASEFAATAAEMRISAVRGQALEGLAQRSGIASLRGVAAALNQSIRFGTPLAESLRVLAGEMRADRLARFEERAARLPVLLTVPLMAFILPALLLVIGTPLALRIIDMFSRGS